MAFSDNFGERDEGTGLLPPTTPDEPTLSPQEQAALALQEGGEAGVAAITEGTDTARADLDPFAQAGAGTLDSLTALINDPNAQSDFITNNPFFEALADDAQRRIFGSAAATGKMKSGGTAEALQNSLLLLGTDLVNNNVTQQMNLANMGLTAAGGQANVSTVGGVNIADLMGDMASAEAAGIMGTEAARLDRKNAKTDAMGNIISAGIGAIAMSDRRSKDNIQHVKDVNGIPYYFFKYKGENDLRFGTMAQDVQHIPGAVIDVGGKMYVDYGRIQ